MLYRRGIIAAVSLEPSRLADFRLAGALGAGATAKVFDAVHIATGRPVAIKMLEPSARGSELRERFAREALFLANVTSQHVSRILGYGFDQGQPFLVLERLVGETLDAKLRRDGPVPPTLAYSWIEQLLAGVRDIHAANVIHRDLKPANIFIQREGSREIVKVIDFGVARLLEAADDGSQGLTSASHLLGSVGYMAPEQFAQASKVTPAADLYAVGVVIFRMITGQLPFVSKQIEAVIRMKREKDPPPLSTMPGAPSRAQLDWFVGKCLSRDLTQRFQSSREALDFWVRIRPTFELEEDLTTNVDKPRSWHTPPSEAAPRTGIAQAYAPPPPPHAPSAPVGSVPSPGFHPKPPATKMPPPAPSFQPRSFSPDSFVRTPTISTIPEAHGPMTMLSPGQPSKFEAPKLERPTYERNPDPGPQSRTGVDIESPAAVSVPASWEVSFEEVPEAYDEWDAVTEKRKAPDFARLEREAHERKKNKP